MITNPKEGTRVRFVGNESSRLYLKVGTISLVLTAGCVVYFPELGGNFYCTNIRLDFVDPDPREVHAMKFL